MFSDAAGTIPTLTTDTTDGFAFSVDVNLDGTTTVSSFSSQTNVNADDQWGPEPGTLSPMAMALGLWIAFRFRQQRRWTSIL
jgi:hypothetical protein